MYMKKLKTVIGIFLLSLIILFVIVSLQVSKNSPVDSISNTDTTKSTLLTPENEPQLDTDLQEDGIQPTTDKELIKYDILFEDKEYRFDGGISYELIIEPVDLSNDNFKKYVELVIDEMVNKYGTKISITIFDNKEICEKIYKLRENGGGLLDKEMLDKRALHLIATFDGELDTMFYTNTLMYFPGAFTDNPVVGKYVSTIEYNPNK